MDVVYIYVSTAVESMDLHLVCTELNFTLEIPLSESGGKRIATQLLRVQEQGDHLNFRIRLAEEIAKIIPSLTDWDLKPPTRAQLAFAKSLSNQLKCEIPLPALHSRLSMQAFLAETSLRLPSRRDQSSQ